MSIISLAGQNVSEETDPIVVEADTEVQLRVVDVGTGVDKNKNPYFMPRFEVVDEPDTKEFTKFFSNPGDHLEAKKDKAAKNAVRKFGESFGFDPDVDLDTDDLLGLVGWAILGVSDNEEYGDQNYVKRFIESAA